MLGDRSVTARVENLLSKCQHVWVITWQIYDRYNFFSVTAQPLTSVPTPKRICLWGALMKWSGSLGKKPAWGTWWVSICGCLGSSSVMLFFQIPLPVLFPSPVFYWAVEISVCIQWRHQPPPEVSRSPACSPALPDFPPKVCCLTETKIIRLQNGMNHSSPRTSPPSFLFPVL